MDNGDGTATLSGSPDPDTAGSYPVTLTAHNGVGSDATQTFTLTVDDPSPPDISYSLNPATPGSGGWYKTPVSLAWTVGEPQSPSALVTTGCIDYVISVDQAQTTYSCSATSTGGSSGPVSVTIGYDATAPTLTPSLPAGTVFAVGTPAPAVEPGATDATAGVASSSCTPVHTGSVGVRSVTCSATDNAGNTSMIKVAYTVSDAFLGFVSPQPKTSHHHGATVAIKFTLGTYAGTARVSTSAVQVRITPLGAPTTVAASATCLYDTTARLYRCDTVMPVAPGAYRVKVWEQVGTGSKGAIYTPLQNAFAVLGKPNANPEAITVN